MSIGEIEKIYMRSDLPDFKQGDSIKVYAKVVEGDRERSQVFEGVVIGRRGGGLNETFTVRKISYGIGIERVFPLHADVIEKIKVIKKGKARRAKLYYLREKIGKKAKVKEESEFGGQVIESESKLASVLGTNEPVKV